jgi:spoIIIJ-associated protein
MIFEAKTLEEVYKQASEYYNKSISELEIKIIQSPSKGIFGFFAKNAIIEILNEIEEETIKEKEKIIEPKTEEIIEKSEKTNEKVELSIDEVIKIAQKEINELFDLSCFNIDNIEVKKYDDETIIFEINGEDSALLIGKEGYRYNALSSMLFSWISQKYGYKTRLEIASFLESQEEMMRSFLEPTIREIEQKGRCKTKPFDGVLAYIAVEILRSEFPHKYVAIKKHRDGSQYIIVNDFLNKND